MRGMPPLTLRDISPHEWGRKRGGGGDEGLRLW